MELSQMLNGYDVPQPQAQTWEGTHIITIYVPMHRDSYSDRDRGYAPSWCETVEQAATHLRADWRFAELRGTDSADYWILAIERTYRDGMQISQRHYRLADDGREDAIRNVKGLGKAIRDKYPRPLRMVGGQLIDRHSDAEITAQDSRGGLIRIIPDEHDREEAGSIWGGRYVEGYLLADGRIIFSGSYVREALDAAMYAALTPQQPVA